MNENNGNYNDTFNNNLETYKYNSQDAPVNENLTEKMTKYVEEAESKEKIKEHIELKQREIDEKIKKVLSNDFMDKVYEYIKYNEYDIPETIARDTHHYDAHSFDGERDGSIAKFIVETTTLLNPLITEQAELSKEKQRLGIELSSRDMGYISYADILFRLHIEDLAKVYSFFAIEFSTSEFGKYAQCVIEKMSTSETEIKAIKK